MINKIELKTIPFVNTAQSLEGLKTFNYFFGANGSGKTTISKIIEDPINYPNCGITWANGATLETRVYNRDFAERNLQSKLKGVFTLGEMEATTLEKIETTKTDIANLAEDIKKLTITLQGVDGNGGKKSDLSQLEQTYKAKFFAMKQKHSDNLSGTQSGEGMKGFIGSQDNFMSKVLTESTGNTATLISQSELEDKAKTVFSRALVTVNLLPEIRPVEILQHEKNPILQKRIIGKNDVDIAAMILKLNNSDWVRQGLSFYEANDGVCPFCQKATDDSFRKSLSEYFDEAFTQDSNTIKTLIDNYSIDAQRLQNQIQAMIDLQSSFLDTEKIKTEKQLLDSIIVINKQKLAEKQKESSQVLRLDSLENVLSKIIELIAAANEKIAENNRIVNNLKNEKTTLTAQIWKFVISELNADISNFKRQKTDLESAIISLNAQISTKNSEKATKESELHELEKQTTTIIPTRDGINSLLNSFGFKSFKLKIGDDGKTYKLIRADGTEAQQTLSEGEKNFVSFLYFYHLLKGSQTETGLANDKVVVFDDPISSLDNDVLFIVTTLIRELIQDVRDKKGSIKQVFILTHNIYFHKEVTYNRCRTNGLLPEESFWLVKKIGIDSIVEKQSENPIKTSYQLLWDEVRNQNRNKATIQNTLRRILENYFKLLGNLPLDKLYLKFNGEDKIKCKALCSWINDGSHNAFNEDYYTSLDDAMIAKYLEVFRQIFNETDQIAHYNMMMGISPEADQELIKENVTDE